MEYTVRSVFETHVIQGTLLGFTTTEEPWKDRWTEISLYKVDPGGAPTIVHPRTEAETLRDGGYLSYVVGPSLRTHTLEIRNQRLCKGGIQTEISRLPDEAQPCPVCRPQFAFIGSDVYEEDMPAERARVRAARAGNSDLVRKEVTRHQIHPAVSAEDIVAGLTKNKTTVPGEDVVRIAAENDPDIRAVLERLGALDQAV